MPKIGQKSFGWLLQNEKPVGAGSLKQTLTLNEFNIKAWASAGNGLWDGASIKVQCLAEDGTTWITTHTFTGDDVQFGRVGVKTDEIFRAFVVTPGANNLSCTITYA